jgi:hypothetical protein
MAKAPGAPAGRQPRRGAYMSNRTSFLATPPGVSKKCLAWLARLRRRTALAHRYPAPRRRRRRLNRSETLVA